MCIAISFENLWEDLKMRGHKSSLGTLENVENLRSHNYHSLLSTKYVSCASHILHGDMIHHCIQVYRCKRQYLKKNERFIVT